MGWKLSRRTHQRFRHLRVWNTTDRYEESCKSKNPAMISEKRFLSTESLEPLSINNSDEKKIDKMKNMLQVAIH